MNDGAASRLDAHLQMSQLDPPSDGDTSRRLRLPRNHPVFKLLAENALSTVRSHKHDKTGKDRYPAPQIKVAFIEKLENPRLQRRYLERLRAIQLSTPKMHL